jgi:hypothetical protein
VSILLLSHLFLTFFMTGVIWFVQIVHYPLMSEVGEDRFVVYERKHQQRTGYMVGPVMVAELAGAIVLFWKTPQGWWILNLALLGLIWAATFFIQVPLHNRLLERYEASWQRRLTASNWARTALWTARAALLMGLLLAGWE